MEDTKASAGAPPIQRVSNIELFFDLVFVFTLTQLTHLIAAPHDPAAYLKTALVFITLGWIYAGFSWLTSNMTIDNWRRYFFFAAMAGFFVMALAIPEVFEASGLPYGLGLLLVVLVHAGLFMTSETNSARAIFAVAPFNIAIALFVIGAAFVEEPWKWLFWLAAGAIPFVVASLRRESGFQISPPHFVERNGLLIILALGESIVDVGVGAEGREIDGLLVLTVVLGLFLCGSIWRTYFDQEDELAVHNLSAVPHNQQVRMALLGFGFAHFVMILGIILSAAGLELAVAAPLEAAPLAGAINLAAGVALYLVGDVAFRKILRLGPGGMRLLVAALCLLTIPLGLLFGPLLQLIACVLLLQILWPTERKIGARSSTH